jgi:hypothetical protein
LSESVMAAPPVGAAPDSVTVQVALADELSAVGVQDTDVRLGAALPPGPVMVPPVPVIIAALPDGNDANGLLNATDVLVTPAGMVKLITARTPSATAPAFIPDTRHV